MAVFEWRKFNFFELRPGADKNIVKEVLKNVDIKSTTYGNGLMFIGDSLGYIHIFKKDWTWKSFQIHEGPVIHTKFCRANNLLVSIGAEEAQNTTFRVWNMAKVHSLDDPILLRSSRIALEQPTALDVSDNGQLMAIGFSKGSISLYRGDIGNDRSKNFKTLSGGVSAITGLVFKSAGKQMQLFVCSDSGVLVYTIHSQDRESKIVLDTTNASVGCCALQTNDSRFFTVGRLDAIYCYTSEDKGPCYVVDGEKIIIEWFRTHLFIVSKPMTIAGPLVSQKDVQLTVIDIKNKFIVLSTPISQVAAIIPEFGSCYILTHTKDVYHMDEKDLQSKLAILFKKNLYDIALRIANGSGCDVENVAEIFCQYGDHLYAKMDFSGAVDQYKKTIGHLEPSYVIRKFLDSRYIDCLTVYLEELHRCRVATADHTILLLNCYTRLNKLEELHEFLHNDTNSDALFDVTTAIKVCRNSSVDHALGLAKRNQRHDLYLTILIDDKKEFDTAIDYLSTLTFVEAEELLRKFGYELMRNKPHETTALLKHKYVQAMVVESPEIEFEHDMSSMRNPVFFLQLFAEHPAKSIEFLEYMVENVPTRCSGVIFNMLIENYIRKWADIEDKETREAMDLSERILATLQKHYSVINQNHVLVLCRQYRFYPGIMWVYEEQRLYHLIVRYYLQERQYNKLWQTCERLAPLCPSLWMQALTGLRTDSEAPSTLLSQILNIILSLKLQSPAQILDSLAVPNGPTLGVVRKYFFTVFNKESESSQRDDEHMNEYKQDTKHLKLHIENLQQRPIEFKSSMCNNCSQPLTIPAVYFFCQHSFHHDCTRGYTDTEKDCPACHTKNANILDMVRVQEESREQHQSFHDELDRSVEPFSVIAEYFGRGLFNKIVVFDENESIPRKLRTVPAPQHELNVARPASPLHYGLGAESKVRLTEGKSVVKSATAVVSEGRMRIQERQTAHKSAVNTETVIRDDKGGQRYSRTPSSTTSVNLVTPSQSSNVGQQHLPAVEHYPKEINPFDENVVAIVSADPNAKEKPSTKAVKKVYDRALDPFAADVDDETNNNNSKPTGSAAISYAKSLNPFE